MFFRLRTPGPQCTQHRSQRHMPGETVLHHLPHLPSSWPASWGHLSNTVVSHAPCLSLWGITEQLPLSRTRLWQVSRDFLREWTHRVGRGVKGWFCLFVCWLSEERNVNYKLRKHSFSAMMFQHFPPKVVAMVSCLSIPSLFSERQDF